MRQLRPGRVHDKDEVTRPGWRVGSAWCSPTEKRRLTPFTSAALPRTRLTLLTWNREHIGSAPVRSNERIHRSAARPAQGFLQVCKFVHDQAGEHRGMAVGLPGLAIQFNYADGRAVVVRDAAGDGEYRLLPRVVLPFQMKVPAGILRKGGADTIMLLRLGAAANALQTVLAQHAQVPEHRRLVDQRNLAHLSIFVVSYIQEVTKIIFGSPRLRQRSRVAPSN